MARHPTPALSRLATLTLLLAAAASPVIARADTAASWIDFVHPTAGAEIAYVENISRTSFEPTRKDTTTYKFDLGGSVPRQLAPSWLLVGSGELSSLFVSDYDLTNNVTASGRFMLQKKFGLGPQALVLQATAGGGYKAARLDDDSGFTIEGSLQLAKRVLPNLRLAANLRWVEHDAQSFVFDLDQTSYGIDAQWDITDRWSLSGNATWLTGDVVANAAPFVWAQMLNGDFGSTIFNYYTSRPSDVTNLYGDGWVSYNVEGDVNLWSVSLSYAITDRLTADATYTGVYFVNKAGVAYPSDTSALRLSYRF